MGIMTFTRQLKPSQLKPGLLYDITASMAVTASYALNSVIPNRIETGSITAQVYPTDDIFLITTNSQPVLTVSASGVITLATHSAELTGTTQPGSVYFTSSSFYVGLE
jgi:hypothetical protein